MDKVENLVDNTIQNVEVVNKSVVSLFKNPFIKYGFLIFVVIRIIFINIMGDYYLELLDYTWMKVTYAFLVAYSACFDPIYAIALATFIIIAFQELYSRRAKKHLTENTKPFLASVDVKANKVLQLPTNPPEVINKVSMTGKPDANILLEDKMVYDTINKHVLQKTPSKDDSLIAEYDYYLDPAFKTITANLDTKKQYLGNNNFYITEDNLDIVQNNQEPGANQNQPIQGINTGIMNIQGIPIGFDKGLGGGRPEFASINSP